MKKYLLVLWLAIFVIQLHGQSTVNFHQLDSLLLRLNQTHRFNGTVLYAENGKIVFKKAYGVADVRTGEALTTHSSFNLASDTKQFIAVGILQLFEKGKLTLDDDFRKYIPELNYKGISIRNMLTHTSGLPEYFDIFIRYRSPLDTLTNEKLIRLMTAHPTAAEFIPGSKWSYCNTNYVLLAAIIERITGMPLQEYIQKNITGPLGLKDTYVYHVCLPQVPRNHVYGFTETNGDQKLNDLTNVDGVTGDGNLYSSVEDLLTWEQSLFSGKLVQQETMQQAFQPVKLNDGSTYPYGFGWFMDTVFHDYYHTGSWAGFRNLISLDTVHKRVLILLSSGNNDAARKLARLWFNGQNISVTPTVLIKNIKLIDGLGTPARDAAVRIAGNKIQAVGQLTAFPGEEVINGGGKVLAPGFIDTHSHVGGSLKAFPDAMAAVNQGVTTIVSGQDGFSDPIDSLIDLMNKNPAAINVATYTGHASIREIVMGKDQLHRPATLEEQEKMKILLEAELKKGSLGLSTGLEYEPAFYSSRDEVIELAKTTAIGGGRYISHVRSEDLQLSDALDEIIEIGRQAKLPVQISHFKIALKDNWGDAPKILAELERARLEGIDITADCYPYEFWSSTIRVLFPNKDFTSLSAATYATEHLFDPEASVMSRFLPNAAFKGKTISAIAALRHETTAQTLIYLVAAAEKYENEHPETEGAETIVAKSMSDNDVASFLSWANTNICSDGSNGGHPRGYGTFTRVLGEYVRAKKIMSLETAIHKMTALSAEHVGLKNIGVIAPGYNADLVLLDPDTVKDNAVIGNSKALSDGILEVWVNGVPVYQNKQSLHHYPGVFISR